MPKSLLFLLIVFSSFDLAGQLPSDSLRNIFLESEDWDTRAKATYEFCKLNVGTNPDECLDMYKEIELNLDALSDSVQIYNMYNVQGILYQYRHELDTSNFYYDQAFQVATNLQDSALLMKCMGNLSINYRNQGAYEKAIGINLEVVKFHQANHDTTLWANALSEIGNSYIYLDNFLEGIAYQRKALRLHLLIQYWNGIGNTYNSMAYAFNEMEMLDSAIFYTELALKAHNQSGNRYGIANAKGSLCSYYQKAKKPDSVVYDCFAECLEFNVEIENKEGMMTSNLNVGRFLSNQQQPGKSLNYLEKALELANELGDQRVKSECFHSLAIAYRDLSNFKKAYPYLDSARNINNTIRNLNIQNAVLEADRKYQVSEKERELLVTQQEKSQIELAFAERNNQLTLVIAGALLLLFGATFAFYWNKQKHKSTLDAVRIEEQQKGLTAIIQVQEEERKRIAKDLHDGIVQQLGGLKLGLQKIFSGHETSDTDKVIEVVDMAAQDLRELSHNMMPRTLSELGLVPALQDMLNNSLGHTDISYDFEQFGVKERFNENIEVAIYRIAQELINNVIKHSGADKVNVQLTEIGQQVIFIVEDNGAGMGGTVKRKGIGLLNISSRLDILNGHVNYEPSPASGTLATVSIHDQNHYR